MTKEFRSSKVESDCLAPPKTLSGHSDFVIRVSFGLRHSSFVIRPRCNAKRIEPPFHAYHPPNGQRDADAPVPRRQVTAFSGFADGFPLASIRTQGELEAIAAGRRHAQINARPDDTTQLGDGLVLVL